MPLSPSHVTLCYETFAETVPAQALMTVRILWGTRADLGDDFEAEGSTPGVRPNAPAFEGGKGRAVDIVHEICTLMSDRTIIWYQIHNDREGGWLTIDLDATRSANMTSF